jgi:hypothetical protein
MKDYMTRMKEFFDYYLMDKPAPKWWTQGIPRLKISDELEARQNDGKQPTEAGAARATPAIQ